MAHIIVGVFDTYSEAKDALARLQNLGILDKNVELHSVEEAGVEPTEGTAEKSMPQMPATEYTGSGEALKVLDRIERFFDGIFRDDERPEEAEHVAEAVRRGHTAVTIDIENEDQVQPVCRALWEAGAVDLEERVSHWRSIGYTGYQRGAPVFTRTEIESERKAYVSRRGERDRGEFQPHKIPVFPRQRH